MKFFTTLNTTTASVFVRCNRTLKTKMWKYFSSKITYKYVNILLELVKVYNRTYHSSIKRASVNANNRNEREVRIMCSVTLHLCSR